MSQAQPVITQAQKRATDAKMARARTLKDIYYLSKAEIAREKAQAAAANALDELASDIASAMPLLTEDQKATLAALFASTADAESVA